MGGGGGFHGRRWRFPWGRLRGGGFMAAASPVDSMVGHRRRIPWWRMAADSMMAVVSTEVDFVVANFTAVDS